MKAFFVSDLHLKAPDDAATLKFAAWLARLPADGATHLFLVGDIFDLWIGNHDFFRRRFAAVVDAIRDLVKAGIEVHFFEGNHDLHLESFWAREIGVRVHADEAYFTLGKQTVRVEHGDLINPEDRGYLFLRRLLRSRPMTTLALNLPSSIVAMIGERASRASRTYTSTAKELPVDRIRSLIRAHAERVAKQKPFDLIVTGHVHVVDDFSFEVDGRKIRSVNLGSWFDGARALLVSDSRIEIANI